jgi:hypothetical protein
MRKPIPAYRFRAYHGQRLVALRGAERIEVTLTNVPADYHVRATLDDGTVYLCDSTTGWSVWKLAADGTILGTASHVRLVPPGHV